MRLRVVASGGGTLDKRVTRLLQLQWDQRMSVDKYTSAVGVNPAPNTAILHAILAHTKKARPGIQKDFTTGMPTTTDVLIETDKMFKPRLFNPGLNAWRACSGITHGNVHFSTGVLKSSPLTGQRDGGPTSLNTISLAGLSLMLDPAISYFEKLIETVTERGREQPGLPEFLWGPLGPPPAQ